MINSICNQIMGHTICPLGDALVMPVRSFLTKFNDEFKGKIEDALAGKSTPTKSLNASFGDGH
jgi:NADH:ubiquinone oxidoreductase subunit F (NADH-binding)